MFPNHSLNVWLSNIYILICQHTKCDYRLWKVLWFNCIFCKFSLLIHVWNVITSSNFYKLCIKTEVLKWKINLCNHLWLRQSSFWIVKIWLIISIMAINIMEKVFSSNFIHLFKRNGNLKKEMEKVFILILINDF